MSDFFKLMHSDFSKWIDTIVKDWRYLIPHHSNVTFWEWVKVSKSRKKILEFSFEPKNK
jgi:hypothetical protein